MEIGEIMGRKELCAKGKKERIEYLKKIFGKEAYDEIEECFYFWGKQYCKLDDNNRYIYKDSVIPYKAVSYSQKIGTILKDERRDIKYLHFKWPRDINASHYYLFELVLLEEGVVSSYLGDVELPFFIRILENIWKKNQEPIKIDEIRAKKVMNLLDLKNVKEELERNFNEFRTEFSLYETKIKEFSNIDIEEIKKEADELKSLSVEISDVLGDDKLKRLQELSIIKDDMQNLKMDLERKKKQIIEELENYEEKEIGKIDETIKEIINEKQRQSEIGYALRTEVQGRIDTGHEHSTLVDNVKVYLKTKGYTYEGSIVSRFLTSLHTDQITVLWGEPGSGKTTLAIETANAIGAKCIPMAVQPNWTDNQDLLGFYNIRDDRYISTTFLEALIEARDNEDILYILLLDEMNLAHIEYYFSEILSAITRSDKTISLYSKSDRSVETEINETLDRIKSKIEEERFNEIKEQCKNWQENNVERLLLDDVLNVENISDEELKDLKERVSRFRYLPKMKIPKNVRFVGTLNMDSTTKDLSPKVIDRSYLIKVNRGKLDIEEEINKSHVYYNECVVNYQESGLFKPLLKPIDDEKIKTDLKKILKTFEIICPQISYRFLMYIRQMLAWNKNVNWDDIIVDKILPQVNLKEEIYSIESEENNVEEVNKDQIIEKIKNMLTQSDDDNATNYPNTIKYLNKMQEQVDEDGECHYWSINIR